MDILIQHGKAHQLFPDGAPEFHKDFIVIKDYDGDVEEGYDWNGTSFIAPVQEAPEVIAASGIRYERDMKLVNEVDPIAGNTLRWNALTAGQQQAWADYRQALLDVPQQDGFPNNVVWPDKPA